MAKKKNYQKPEINQVKLVPEEAVLLGCKRADGIGGKTDKCTTGNACKSEITS